MAAISMEEISKKLEEARGADDANSAVDSLCEAFTNLVTIVGNLEKTIKSKTPVKAKSEVGKGDAKTAKTQTVTKSWNDYLAEDDKANRTPTAKLVGEWLKNNYEAHYETFNMESTDLQKCKFFWKYYGKDFATKNNWPNALNTVKEGFNKIHTSSTTNEPVANLTTDDSPPGKTTAKSNKKSQRDAKKEANADTSDDSDDEAPVPPPKKPSKGKGSRAAAAAEPDSDSDNSD